jgi:hypothetical protein
MGLHAYCVVPEQRIPHHPGIGGARVQAVPMSPVAVWTSEHAHRPVATVEAARTHDAVIRAALDEHSTPVPLRFGQWFEDAPRLVAAVREKVPGWSALLEQLAGTVEMGVRVIGTAPAAAPVPTAGTGTDYMHALRERHHAAAAAQAQRDAVLATLRDTLGPLVEREFVEPGPEGASVLSVAYLVRRARLAHYHDALASLPDRLAPLHIHATGPWPPYSFVA